MNPDPLLFNRRRFLETGVRTMAVGGALSLLASSGASAAKSGNPFPYDVRKFEKVDPKLIRYEEVTRFPSPRPQARRLVWAGEAQWLLAAGESVCLLDDQGQVVREMPTSDPARCVAVAPDGLLYFGVRDHVEVYDRHGQRQATWEKPPGKPWLSGLAVTANDVVAADSGNRVLWRYDRSGKRRTELGKKNAARQVPGFALPSPYLDVELHPDGLLRVNNPGRHRVEAYTLDGDCEQFWGEPGVGIAGFCGCCNPISLSILPDGRIVTAEKGLPRVKVYRADGTMDAVVAGPESFPGNVRDGGDASATRAGMAGLDVAADPAGRIAILDLAAGLVRIMARQKETAEEPAKA